MLQPLKKQWTSYFLSAWPGKREESAGKTRRGVRQAFPMGYPLGTNLEMPGRTQIGKGIQNAGVGAVIAPV